MVLVSLELGDGEHEACLFRGSERLQPALLPRMWPTYHWHLPVLYKQISGNVYSMYVPQLWALNTGATCGQEETINYEPLRIELMIAVI